MLVTNHVLSGAVIGATTRRIVPAFLLGIASHFALDAAPHWGPRNLTLMQVAVPDESPPDGSPEQRKAVVADVGASAIESIGDVSTSHA